MKFLVDEMPSCSWDCPFFTDDGSNHCKLDDCLCDCMTDKMDFWGQDDCRWLKVV